MAAKRTRRIAGEVQVSLRLPAACLTRADRVAERLRRDPKMAGSPVNRAFVLRRALISGLKELEEEMNILAIHWRNCDPPNNASEFDGVLQDFVRGVSVPLIGPVRVKQNETRGLGNY